MEMNCVNCGNSAQPDSLIRFGDDYVCADCKPIYVQKLRENPTMDKPKVVVWFWRYCLIMTSTFLLFLPLAILKPVDDWWEKAIGLIAVFAYVLFFGIPLVSKRQPWAYKYARVVILLSLCTITLPIAIPMLIFWRKDDVKEYYNCKNGEEPSSAVEETGNHG